MGRRLRIIWFKSKWGFGLNALWRAAAARRCQNLSHLCPSLRGVAQWQSACFGSRRLSDRVRPSRPFSTGCSSAWQSACFGYTRPWDRSPPSRPFGAIPKLVDSGNAVQSELRTVGSIGKPAESAGGPANLCECSIVAMRRSEKPEMRVRLPSKNSRWKPLARFRADL